MSNSQAGPYPVFEHNIAAASNPAYYVPGSATITSSFVASKDTTPSKDKILTYDVHCIATDGSAFVGVITVEYTNATDKAIANGTAIWKTYTALTVPIDPVNIASSNPGGTQDIGIELVDIGFHRIRLKFTWTSGSGSVHANVVTC